MSLMTKRERLHEYLQNQNMRAFLRAIRLGEGTLDPLGYRRIVGGGEFASYADHPRKLVRIPRYNVNSSAAGAFQIIKGTWDGLVRQYGFPDFSPSMQDEAAVALILEKGAADLVLRGQIPEAIHRCRNVWASLPGSEAGQRTESLQAVLQVYHGSGGSTQTA